MESARGSIAVRVLTPSVDIHERFGNQERLEDVLSWALAAIGYAHSEGEFNLYFGQDNLDVAKPIAEYVDLFGWKDGTTLELVPRHVAAGAV
jgi:hypothetical protein